MEHEYLLPFRGERDPLAPETAMRDLCRSAIRPAITGEEVINGKGTDEVVAD